MAQPFRPEPVPLGGGPAIEYPQAADFDGDGLPELVSSAWPAYLVWSGRPPTVTSTIETTGFLSIADFTGDGVPDVLVEDELRVYEPGWPVIATYATPMVGYPGDMDGDGDLDVASYNGATWFENLGGGLTMSSAPQVGVPADASCRPVDVNMDGSVDLQCAEWAGKTLSWYENDGTGFRFTAHIAYENLSAYAVASGPPVDVDADGDLDLVFTEQYLIVNFVFGRLMWAPGDPTLPDRYGPAVELADPNPTVGVPVVGTFGGSAWIARGGEVLPFTGGTLGPAVPTVGSGYDVQWIDWDGDGVEDELLTSGLGYAIVFDGFDTGFATSELLTYSLGSPLGGADIDGDGDDELVAGDAILTRTDDWGKDFEVEITGSNFVPAWGDFDEDGLLDTVSGSTLYERNPDGTWSTTTLFTLTGSLSIRGTRTGDVDADGDVDIVIFKDDGTFVWLDVGGLWTQVEVDLENPFAGDIGDLDGDGDLDLVAATTAGERWFENRDGTGTLWVERTLSNLQCGWIAGQVAVDDLDGDGDNDVWMTGCNRFYERTAVGFTEVFVDLSGFCVVGDVDLDGDLDVITAGQNFEGTRWLERRSAAIADFDEHEIDPDNSYEAALLDLDEDGDDDLAVSKIGGVWLFRNDTLTPVDDPDSDGLPDVSDGCPLDWDPLQDDGDADGATEGCDCAPADATRYPGAPESCQAVDDDCDGATDEDFDVDLDHVTTCGHDGVFGTFDDDCADDDAAISPMVSEVVYNGVDDDCSPATRDDDLDQDGFDLVDDCDDSDADANPGLAEVVYDGIDNDCDPTTWDDDLDGDGFDLVDDCDDGEPAVNPGELEVPYDGTDQDCDPNTRDDDLDKDGFVLANDCDDGDRFVSPDRAEVAYDGVDNDCSPVTRDDDLDGDGALLAEDCDDADAMRSELLAETPYDGIDNDCDPITLDDDLDGDGAPLAEDCDDTDPARAAGPEITYDGIDNDCDPITLDDDLDGDGAPLVDDCDDADPTRSGQLTEIAYDGIDNDCDLATVDDDLDGDGYGVVGDCDDSDPAAGPPPCTQPDDDGAAGAGCGCAQGGAATGAWGLALAGLLVRRRERGSTPNFITSRTLRP